MTAARGIRARLVNLALAACVTVGILLAAEPILRMRYVEPEVDRPVVREVQAWLELDPDVGYTWRANVSPDRNVRFQNADVDAPPLSTDEFGIINAPEAIAERRAGRRVNVLGLGDSFMEMAAPDFYRAFGADDRLFYSLAIHRHAPPHYARMFAAHGLALQPDAVVVGLFENDFTETADFEAWQQSGLDWFAFHSGTWCGPPVPVTAFRRLVDRHFAGYQGLARVVRARVRGERMTVSGPSDAEIDRVVEELDRIADTARANGIDAWIVLIPSKPTARGEPTAESDAFDVVADRIGPGVAGVVDLRPVFQGHPDPASLYYREDGHWNPAGVALAARTLMDRMAAAVVDESRSD